MNFNFLEKDGGVFEKKEIVGTEFSEEIKKNVESEFEKFSYLIVPMEIRRKYAGRINDKKSSESGWLIKKGRKEIPLEVEAQNYLTNKGYLASKTLLESTGKVFNIFHLATKETHTKGKKELISKNKEFIKLIKKIIPNSELSKLSEVSRGLPDLILLNEALNDFAFCEVKSENDFLSPVQKAWYLQNLNLFEYKKSKYILLKVLKDKKYRKLKYRDNTTPSEYKFYVKGTEHSKEISKEYISRNLKEGVEVRLEKEPSNKHDNKAIRVINSRDGKKIGYIQREKQDFHSPDRRTKTKKDKIWDLLEGGQEYSCKIVSIDFKEGKTNGSQTTLGVFTGKLSSKKGDKKTDAKCNIICNFRLL